MPWQGAMNLCYHEDVLYSKHDGGGFFGSAKKYPMKYSHGTCLENKFGSITARCKDNAPYSKFDSSC